MDPVVVVVAGAGVVADVARTWSSCLKIIKCMFNIFYAT